MSSKHITEDQLKAKLADYATFEQVSQLVKVEDRIIGRLEDNVDRFADGVEALRDLVDTTKEKATIAQKTAEAALEKAKHATTEIDKIKKSQIPWVHIGAVLGTIGTAFAILKYMNII